jgi:hypothetical protein
MQDMSSTGDLASS